MMMPGKMSKTPTIIVPTRLTSTRFPRKLLHPVRGKPVVLWTAERIRREAPEFPLYFAVDDPELEDCLETAGFQTVMTRADHPSGTDRLAEANAAVGAEAVINVQGDEPLVTGGQIRALAEGLKSGAAISTLAVPFARVGDVANPNQVKVVRDRAGLALYFSRSMIPFARECPGGIDDAWLAAHPVFRHLGLYAYRADFLAAFATLEPGYLEGLEKLEQLRAMEHGYKIHVGITAEASIGIDTPDDIAPFEARLDGSV